MQFALIFVTLDADLSGVNAALGSSVPDGGRPGPADAVRSGLLSFLPRGGTLLPAAWARRHRAIVLLLWVHIPALAAFGLVSGVPPMHATAEMAILAAAALVAGFRHLPRPVRMAAASFGLASASAILVHFSGGYIEMHFHFFVVVVIVSLYQHWLPFLATIAYVAVHHGVLGAVDPTSVFNHPDAIAQPWKWAGIHAGFILAESAAAIYAWRQSENAQLEAKTAAAELAEEGRRLGERTAALALLEEVASAANTAADVDAALEAVLEAVCSYTDWPIGHGYLVGDDPSAALVDTGIWRWSGAAAMDEFRKASQQVQLVPGVGLGGRVVELGRALSVPDLAGDPHFSRKAAAASAGLVSAFAFPILVGPDVAGVLEFFAVVPHAPPDELLALMDQVGAQLGRVIERRRASESVSDAVHALERRNREVTLIGEMGEFLQSCDTVEESYDVVSRYAGRLFPNHSGAVYVLAASRNIVEAVASWGDALSDDEAVFAPSACWALRRGRAHEAGGADGLHCIHVEDGAVGAACIPMVAQSEALGVFHLRAGRAGDAAAGVADAATRQLAHAVAEHLALALANFRLRASLRAQSIRDPLTGLYNRRYLEESLERELRRAARNTRPLSIVSIDIDHFKKFNDTFGHSAGDAVLASVGRAILGEVRGEDIACRVGGEELVLILPDCPEDVARERAEELRHVVRRLTVDFNGQALGMITISLGVASFPAHGATADALLIAADTALYAAKAAGRDRTLVHS